MKSTYRAFWNLPRAARRVVVAPWAVRLALAEWWEYRCEALRVWRDIIAAADAGLGKQFSDSGDAASDFEKVRDTILDVHENPSNDFKPTGEWLR